MKYAHAPPLASDQATRSSSDSQAGGTACTVGRGEQTRCPSSLQSSSGGPRGVERKVERKEARQTARGRTSQQRGSGGPGAGGRCHSHPPT
jgi:hypothetical protein